LSSEESKREVVSDMEEHFREMWKVVEEMKRHSDPAADTKYNNMSTFSVCLWHRNVLPLLRV